MSKVYGYARVSSKIQLEGNSLEHQISEITNRYPSAEISEEQYTGTKTNRPMLDKLIDQLQEGDTLVVTKLDRFARSVQQGSKLINELINRGVKVDILNIGVMDNTPTSKLIRNIFLSFAEFERDMIIERTAEGKAIAKQRPDYKEGRPKKYTPKQLDHALSMLSVNGGKHSFTQVEEITNISKSTLVRENRKYNKERALQKEIESNPLYNLDV